MTFLLLHPDALPSPFHYHLLPSWSAICIVITTEIPRAIKLMMIIVANFIDPLGNSQIITIDPSCVHSDCHPPPPLY